jgi:hypothetical protein
MAHLPIDDARDLFTWTTPKTWSAFSKVLQQHKGKVDGISDALIDLMMPISQHFEQTGKPFPNTPEQLQEVLNHELASMR